jgi:hypothetical protein
MGEITQIVIEHTTTNYALHSRNPKQKRSTAQKASTAHQTASPDTASLEGVAPL